MGESEASWQPTLVTEAQQLFADAPFRWWVCGGHALELHLGQHWRAHHDLDIGVVRHETSRVYEWLRGWDLRLAVGGNNLWARRSTEGPWLTDITIGDGDETEWIYRRDPSVRRPWTSAVLRSVDDIPYLAPDLQLLFKSRDPRPQDHLDAEHVLPALTDIEREFLFNQIALDHPWR